MELECAPTLEDFLLYEIEGHCDEQILELPHAAMALCVSGSFVVDFQVEASQVFACCSRREVVYSHADAFVILRVCCYGVDPKCSLCSLRVTIKGRSPQRFPSWCRPALVLVRHPRFATDGVPRKETVGGANTSQNPPHTTRDASLILRHHQMRCQP